jgi:hypothetical protein
VHVDAGDNTAKTFHFDAPIPAGLPLPADGTDPYVTATATDPYNNTSEFSPARDALRQSVGSADDPKTLAAPQGPDITEFFIPTLRPNSGIRSLQDVARIADVASFNWVQYFTRYPPDWTYYTYTGNFPPDPKQ